MSEFEKNTIATDEDYFELSSNVYDNDYLHKGASIEGANGQTWRVIEFIDADKEKVKNGLQAIAVVPAKKYDENAT
ncbi:cytoplasmic protein, partial [Bacillus pseudomycoides]